MPSRHWMSHLALACSIATLLPFGAGCQLIMDDIARADADAGDVLPDAGIDASGGADADAATFPEDAPSSDAGEDATPNDAAQDADLQPDAAAADAARDAGLPDPDPSACDGAGERIFYRDSDRDGRGDPGQPRIACEAPANYVEDDGDCDDRNGKVFRGQTDYFDAGYAVPGTSVPSFDYDCDDQETAAPNQQQFQQCTSGILGCTGGGYRQQPDRVNMPGINPFCGSNVRVMCGALMLIACGEDNVTVPDPFLCR